METFDIYTPLLSMYRSNRYQLVRENTLWVFMHIIEFTRGEI
jgi:hypothetical protein